MTEVNSYPKNKEHGRRATSPSHRLRVFSKPAPSPCELILRGTHRLSTTLAEHIAASPRLGAVRRVRLDAAHVVRLRGEDLRHQLPAADLSTG